MIELLGSGPALSASLDGAWHLSEVQHAKICFRMPKRIVRKRARHSFRSGHPKVVDVIRIGRVRKIAVNYAPRKIGAIPRDSVKMVLIWQRVEFSDEFAVLLNGGIDHENVEAANKSGRNQFSPFRLVTRRAGWPLTIPRQVFRLVALLQQVLDFVRAEERAMPSVLDTVEVHIERHDVPFKRPLLADVDVIAHHGTLFTGSTQPEFHGRFRADARKIHGTVSCPCDPVNTGVQRLIEHNSHVTVSRKTGEAHESDSQTQRKEKHVDRPAYQGRSRCKIIRFVAESRHPIYLLSIQPAGCTSVAPVPRRGPINQQSRRGFCCDT